MKPVSNVSFRRTGVVGVLLSLLAGSGGGAAPFLAGCGGALGGGDGSTVASTTSTGHGDASVTTAPLAAASTPAAATPAAAAAATATATMPDATTITTARRAAAATAAAKTNPLCTSLPTAFYWEIGDVTHELVSGHGGADAGAVDASKPMPLASASKWLFGAYALQKRSLEAINAAGDEAYLNFTSGYDNLNDDLCAVTPTVAECFNVGNNNKKTGGDVGKFFYNGGHLQAYAVNVAGLGGDYRSDSPKTPQLAVDVQAAIGALGLTYKSPLPSGGGWAKPSEYAAFLRSILSGQLAIGKHLGADAVCAWTHHPDCNAIYSPVNESRPGAATNDVSDEKWHYAIAHWIEQDGTFSSPGAYGFYPWIDASTTYYGILARDDENKNEPHPAYFASVQCGRAIRNAWLNPSP